MNLPEPQRRSPAAGSRSPQTSRAVRSFPGTQSIPILGLPKTPTTPDGIRRYLRGLGITEQVLIHEQDYDQFLKEQGITELGRGGEGTVYFLRGHVVKVINEESAGGALREVAHMLHINRPPSGEAAMGDRSRQDWPSLVWVYSLSGGSLAIGMKPFDLGANLGNTLYERLTLGPPLERGICLRMVTSLCRSLVHAHRSGIIHHDLKPANVYLPADPAQDPVIFDLGQALWQNGPWGRKWLRHDHNYYYWYNGTYRYMQLARRQAHLGAIATSQKKQPLPRHKEAFAHYEPSYYDDIFAFARILRDFLRSKQVCLHNNDRNALKLFYKKLMGLEPPAPRTNETHKESGIMRRIRLAFNASGQPEPPPAKTRTQPELIYSSMQVVLTELEQIIEASKRSA